MLHPVILPAVVIASLKGEGAAADAESSDLEIELGPCGAKPDTRSGNCTIQSVSQ